MPGIVQVIVSLPVTAEENMGKDKALFEGLKKGEIPPIRTFGIKLRLN